MGVKNKMLDMVNVETKMSQVKARVEDKNCYLTNNEGKSYPKDADKIKEKTAEIFSEIPKLNRTKGEKRCKRNSNATYIYIYIYQ